MAEHFPAPWNVHQLTATIYAPNVPKGPARVADMRGWGYLTGKGDGALALPENEAIDIQRANAAFIVDAVNNHETLVKALQAARDWIVSNTSCESGSAGDEIMYRRGWWDSDERLMKQIDDTLARVGSAGDRS